MRADDNTVVKALASNQLNSNNMVGESLSVRLRALLKHVTKPRPSFCDEVYHENLQANIF